MNREVTEVCNYFKTKSIHIPTDNEWISSCVDCFKEQGKYSIKELCDLVYQQWLLADLGDIGVKTIPDGLLINKKFILNGKYAVQINYAVNVAVSFHKQFQKIRRPEVSKNLEIDSGATIETQKREDSGVRMLKIELTDGVSTFIGFEDQLISCLKEPFVPGMKVLLVGPIECRNGVAFLKGKNIFILGGEVDSLLFPNAVENVLARALKLPENPNPYSQHINVQLDTCETSSFSVNAPECFDDDEEAMVMLAEVIEKKAPGDICNRSSLSDAPVKKNTPGGNCNSSKLVENPLRGNVSMNPTPIPKQTHKGNYSPHSSSCIPPQSNNSTYDLGQRGSNPHHNSHTKLAKRVFSISEDFDDDFDLIAAETAAAIETSRSNTSKDSIDCIASQHNTYEMFDVTSAKKEFQEISDLKKKLTDSYGNLSSTSNNTSELLNFREDGKIVVDYLSDEVSPLTKLPLEPGCDVDMSDSCTNIESEYFSIEPFPPSKRPATITTFGRVVQLLSKPKIVHGKWFVNALVEAKGIKLETLFESDVTDKIFSVSVAEVNSKRGELTSDPVKKEEMNKRLKESHAKLISLACTMTFHFKDAISAPVVTDIDVGS